MFLFLAFTGTQIALNAAGTQQLTSSDNPAPDVSKLIYISFAFGVSLAINVAIFADISGGKFNPAVSSAKHVVHPESHSLLQHLHLSTRVGLPQHATRANRTSR